MHFVFLLEDFSTEKLIKTLMDQLIPSDGRVTYECHSFRGIGGFPHKNKISDIKTGKLLNDLTIYLGGFDKSLKGISAAVFVVVDNDDRDTEQFRAQLENIVKERQISVDHVFCIAVEEMEAWLLGDREALKAAYPKAKESVLKTYIQDSICGTWELLADAIYPGGIRALKKYPYNVIGTVKSDWAGNIGKFMRPEENISPSFAYFYTELKNRITRYG